MVIRPIEDAEIEAAKRVIEDVCFEFFGRVPVEFEDMENMRQHYTGNAGTFLVLVDGERVVGTGAIRRLDDSTCELKRMWFRREYRGRGLGKQMAQMLLQSACDRGYKKVRLDTAAELQQAIRLYQKLGFKNIERYNDGPCSIFMEKTL